VQSLYVGPKEMYLRAGFESVREVADFTVVRKSI